MPEYRIVAKIDPSGAVQGAAAVKQQLAGIEQAAGAAGAASERMTAAQYRSAKAATNEFSNLAQAIGQATAAQNEAEQAARRVEAVVDQEAAAQRRLNALLRDAETAYKGGALSAGNYAKMQQMATQGMNTMAGVTGRTRAGFTQLSFQIGDIAQGLAMGTKASTIFAQQSGQVIQSFQVMGGEGNAFLRFLSGPWGLAVATAAVVLGPFIGKLFDGSNALGDEIAKLKEDAAASDVARMAKEAFSHTLEGVKQALDDEEKAIHKNNEGMHTAAEQANIHAKAMAAETAQIRDHTVALLENAKAMQQRVNATLQAHPGEHPAESSAAQAEVDQLDADLKTARDNAARAASLLAASRQALFVEQATEQAKAQSTPEGRISATAERLRNAARDRVGAEIGATKELAKQVTLGKQLEAQLLKINQAEAAQIKALQTHSASSGLSGRRVSFEDAESIARGAGLAVTSGYRSTAHQAEIYNDPHYNHPGNPVAKPGTSAHEGVNGKWALDIAFAPGLNPQRIRKVYGDQGVSLSAIYKETGHYHIEGMRTEGEIAAQRDANEAAKKAAEIAKQKTGFVQSVVDNAAKQGMPDDRATKLQTDIAAAVADYMRRFSEAPTQPERDKMVGALTEADARAQAEHFRTAYVQPLDDLKSALGQTGLQREVYIKLLDEEHKKGAPLSDLEKEQITNSVMMGDQLAREQQVLEGIAKPLEDYSQKLKALIDLLQQGKISQRDFNAQVSDLQAPARQVLAGMDPRATVPGGFKVEDPGQDTRNYQTAGDASAAKEEVDRYQQQLALIDQARKMQLDLGVSYDALEEAAHLQHAQKLAEIDQERHSTELMAASSTFDSLAQIAAAGFGKQSEVYRAMFAVSKAFAIADSILKIQQAMANALALPFPANLPELAVVAGLGASIVGNIMAIGGSFDRGGYTGDGARHEVAGVVHGQEYVVNASATSRNRPILEAMNAGWTPRPANANQPRVAHARPVVVNIDASRAPGIEFQQGVMTEDRVEIIARRVVDAHAPQAVATGLQNPNSRVSKSLTRVTTARRKRG